MRSHKSLITTLAAGLLSAAALSFPGTADADIGQTNLAQETGTSPASTGAATPGSAAGGAEVAATLGSALDATRRATHGTDAAARAPRTCNGEAATLVGTRHGEVLRGTARRDVIIALRGRDSIYGKGGDDVICTGPGLDLVTAGGGADVAIAGGGDDIFWGGRGSDIVLAGGGDDLMYGDGGIDGLLGMAGDDTYDGGAGALDLAAFLASPAGVVADLANAEATGEGQDLLVDVEALMGSDQHDQLLGDSDINAMFAGDDDVLDGRGESDFVLLTNASGPVEIDLGDDAYTGGGLARGIENVIGSDYDDTIYGDSTHNYLDGGAGTDAVDGIDGTDLCVAETVLNCRDLTYYDAPPASPTTARSTGPANSQADPLTLPDGGQSVLPPAGAPPAPRTAKSVTAYGFVNCPVMSRYAVISTFIYNSTGFFAARTSQGFGGWFPWHYSPVMYLDGTSFWAWYGQWYGPFNIQAAGGWVFQTDIGAQLTAEAYWYSYATQQYYYLGSCMGSAALPGIFNG